jgi:hypothetical protein
VEEECTNPYKINADSKYLVGFFFASSGNALAVSSVALISKQARRRAMAVQADT